MSESAAPAGVSALPCASARADALALMTEGLTAPAGVNPATEAAADGENGEETAAAVAGVASALAVAAAEIQTAQSALLALLHAERAAWDASAAARLPAVAAVFGRLPQYTQQAKRAAARIQALQARVTKMKKRAAEIQARALRAGQNKTQQAAAAGKK